MQPRIGDAFGDALQDALAGVGGAYVVERNDGYVDVESGAENLVDAAHWPPWDVDALDFVSGRVLDVGAGAGRHTLALQNRGHHPVALDTSPGAIHVCERRGVTETFLGTISALAHTDPEPFDAALLLGNNLGLLGSPEEAGAFLGVLAHLLTPAGLVVGTCLDPYRTTDPDHLALHERNRKAGLLAGQLTLRVRYGYVATEWFNYLFASPTELRQIAEASGWCVEYVADTAPIYLAVLKPNP